MGTCQIRAAVGLIVTTHVAETAMPAKAMREWMKRASQGKRMYIDILQYNYAHTYSSPCFGFSGRGIVLHQNVNKY